MDAKSPESWCKPDSRVGQDYCRLTVANSLCLPPIHWCGLNHNSDVMNGHWSEWNGTIFPRCGDHYSDKLSFLQSVRYTCFSRHPSGQHKRGRGVLVNISSRICMYVQDKIVFRKTHNKNNKLWRVILTSPKKFISLQYFEQSIWGWSVSLINHNLGFQLRSQSYWSTIHKFTSVGVNMVWRDVGIMMGWGTSFYWIMIVITTYMSGSKDVLIFCNGLIHWLLPVVENEWDAFKITHILPRLV